MKRIISVILAILLVSTMLMSFVSCGGSDETEEAWELSTVEAVYTESATPVNKTSAEVLAYFNSLVNDLKVSKPAISYNYQINVPNDSMKVTKKGMEDAEEIDESLKAINDSAAGIKDMILKNINERSGDIPFGADNTEYLFVKGESWTSDLTVADIDYATIKEVGDNYYITIMFDDIDENGAADPLAKAFNLRDKEELLASEEFAKTSAYLKLNDYSIAYSGCKITAVVNRLTDEITNLNYYKAAEITADMTGAGSLEDYGDVSVIFTLEDKADFNITWETELPTSPLETSTEAAA